MVQVDIGEFRFITDTDGGDTRSNKDIQLFGNFEVDYVNNTYNDEFNLKNGPVAYAQADPGLDLLSGGAQVYKIIEFTGSGTETAQFEIDIEFDVEAIAAGGDVMLKTEVFAYDFDQSEFLEKDTIDEATDPGTALASLWANSGSASEDIFAVVSAGDTIAVGTRVLVGAASGGVSTAYADARRGPSYEGNEFVKQNDILLTW